MKSSTIRRSNLSKEKIAVLEALSKFNGSNNDNSNTINDSGINNEPMDDISPEVYVRRNKEKELDILWKDFKIPKGENSPIIYLGIGFVAGIIATLVVSAFIGMSSGDFHPNIGSSNTETVAEVSIPEDSSASAIETTETSSVTETSAEETAEPEAKTKKFGFFGSKKANEEANVESAAQANKEYEVQSGDTMEQIVRNFYGTYSEEKVNTIMKANNMTNPNKLSIGQKLIIPITSTSTAE